MMTPNSAATTGERDEADGGRDREVVTQQDNNHRPPTSANGSVPMINAAEPKLLNVRYRRMKMITSVNQLANSGASQSEVENLGRPVGRHDQVVWLDVPMDEAGDMGVGQTARCVLSSPARLDRGQRSRLHPIGERLPVHVLHHQQTGVSDRFGVEGRDDVRVVQVGRPREPRAESGRSRRAGRAVPDE